MSNGKFPIDKPEALDCHASELLHTDMQAEICDVRSEMRQLNQNHIDHLNRHHD